MYTNRMKKETRKQINFLEMNVQLENSCDFSGSKLVIYASNTVINPHAMVIKICNAPPAGPAVFCIGGTEKQ